jgi:colicin import membrane protein
MRQPRPHSVRQLGLVVLLGLAVVTAVSAQPDSAVRDSLTAERITITQRFEAEEDDCQRRFAVTGCVADVRARRRDALAPLRERELQLDDKERRERVAQREADLAAKRQAQLATPAVKAVVEQRARNAPPAAAVDAPTPSEAAPAKADGSRAAAAAERAKAAAKRREAALATQAAIAKKLADRAASGKAAAPLPVPSAAPVSAASAASAARR